MWACLTVCRCRKIHLYRGSRHIYLHFLSFLYNFLLLVVVVIFISFTHLIHRTPSTVFVIFVCLDWQRVKVLPSCLLACLPTCLLAFWLLVFYYRFDMIESQNQKENISLINHHRRRREPSETTNLIYASMCLESFVKTCTLKQMMIMDMLNDDNIVEVFVLI